MKHEQEASIPLKPKKLGREPFIHETAIVEDCTLGRWTEIDARVHMVESSLGEYSYVIHDSQIVYAEIGKFCSIASFARINPGNHPLERAALHHFTYRSRQFDLGEDDPGFFDWRRAHRVVLGHDVWVGHGATIMPGVKVGSGAVIAAGTVVTKDVAPFTIVAGVPSRPLRSRFPQAIQEELLRIAWWDWPHERLRNALQDFRISSVEQFLKKYGG